MTNTSNLLNKKSIQLSKWCSSVTKSIYIKELATLTLKAPAQSILTDKGDLIIAVAKVGKGRVFAICDPWLYNEYVNAHKIPMSFENFNAAKDLAKWLLQGKK